MRLHLVGTDPSYIDHLRHYSQMDIGLDPFPYHGTTTTCEAMWMGVPVITLAGKVHRSRVGVSLLTNVGHIDEIAATAQDYVRAAMRLSADAPRLPQLRSELRQKLRDCPLMQPVQFTRNLESAYRTAWQRWCSEQSDQ